jgi:hypothetical protein
MRSTRSSAAPAPRWGSLAFLVGILRWQLARAGMSDPIVALQRRRRVCALLPDIAGDPERTLDRRLVLAVAVGMDALQSLIKLRDGLGGAVIDCLRRAGQLRTVTSAAPAGRGRERSGSPGRVGFIELFFDLVFVFAITQVSHLLLEHLTLSGAAATAFVLAAVWWTWITVLWWTDWVGTESGVMRLELIAAMVACMLMAITIPEAFGDRGMLFAAGYVGARAPLHAYAFVALPREQHPRLAAVFTCTCRSSPGSSS